MSIKLQDTPTLIYHLVLEIIEINIFSDLRKPCLKTGKSLSPNPNSKLHNIKQNEKHPFTRIIIVVKGQDLAES